MKKMMIWAAVLLLTIGGFVRLDARPPKGWMTDLNKARALSAKSGKPIMLVIAGRDWNKMCRILHRRVLDNPGFLKHARRYAVMFYVEIPAGKQSAALNRTLRQIKSYDGAVPHYALLNNQLKVIARPKDRTVADFNRAVTKAYREMRAAKAKAAAAAAAKKKQQR